ncbi:hypothetical protein [Bifidobacterium scaligerum]|uniref:CTP synthase n=1 Tax=Bifidobacterium scaligerum TaxID=2052656 RepID=A0A2M9HRN1_9BIFI|nr:hypothetical protein [Bifidobacterium scaligerum]PJM79470.1 hypothetical protein CUU80_05525 [Bifidobacterium scaligerum]
MRPDYWLSLDARSRYLHIVRSLSQMHPGWIFCDMTAAAVYGVNTSTRHMDLIHIRTVDDKHVHDYGKVRHHYIREEHYEIVDGIRVTPLARTVFDCARGQSFPDALAVIEAVLRNRMMNKDKLERCFESLPGWHRKAALAALKPATGHTENGGEAYSLGVILEERFAMPLLQESIVDPYDAYTVYRVDFAWRNDAGGLIVAELDGRVKYTDRSMFRNGSLSETIIAEKEREERIRLVVDDMVRFSFREALDRAPLVHKLESVGVPRRG